MPTPASPVARCTLATLALLAMSAAATASVWHCPGSVDFIQTPAPPADISSTPSSAPLPGELRLVPALPGLDDAPRRSTPVNLHPIQLASATPVERAVLVQVSMHHASATSQPTEMPPRRLDSATAGASFAGLSAAGALIGLAIRKLPR